MTTDDAGSVAAADHRHAKLRVWAIRIAIGLVALLLLAVLAIAAAPVGWLKPRIETAITDATGAPARVGSVERAEAFSFTPTIIVRDVHIAQPDWAGKGDLLTLSEARFRVPVLRAIRGQARPDGIRIAGLRAHLIRDEQGRRNWERDRKDDAGSGSPTRLNDLTIEDAVVRYDDAQRNRSATVRIAFDAQGLRVSGRGMVRDRQVRIVAVAPPITDGPWPFRAEVTGDSQSMRLDGRMAQALDTGRFTGKVTARGDSLKTLDAILEAGLPGTQPVRFTADIERRSPDWIVTNLDGTVGRSNFSGELTVEKRGGRTKLTGKLDSSGFDFDDLADDAGRARGAAKAARTGPRVVPDTDINIGNIDTTDGRIEFNLRRLLWRQPAPFRSARGVLTMDDRQLTVEPLSAALTRGGVSGRIFIDARGREVPMLTLDLKLSDSTLATFAGHGDISGSLRGRAVLTGPGRTLRQAVANSNGMVGLVATNGVLPGRMASFIGLDIGRGVTGDSDERARLNCLVFRMDLRGGTGRLNPLVVDTSKSQANVTGTIDMKTDRLNWSLTGAPKQRSLLRYDRPLPIGGTIKNPDAFPPQNARSVGTVFRLLGKAITGKQPPLATDANCGVLALRALK
ncbi:AsmA family protein [Sphingomonas sp. AX6]|uniref:AsmA family protein n=1 Tax=Sphingomonas sp. AX6 TaxID=2653171 RepID=UPI0012F033F4|nr:AsmA family protein [Sphingomonas sp. AX6]VXC45248.1 AsmA family protein [Sphingomonas sp. AX6]